MTTSYVPKQRKSINVFWAEMAACEHCVQIYDDDAAFLDALEGYVASALGLDEAVIIIATGSHTELLTNRLQVSGIDMPGAIATISLSPSMPHARSRHSCATAGPMKRCFCPWCVPCSRARAYHVRVRASVKWSLLWANGEREATIRLEHLWARLCKSDEFDLFCAYPRAGFTQDAEQSMMDVRLAHSVVFNEA